MPRVAIVDYGAGNLDSVARALDVTGGSPVLAREPAGLAGATHVVLPGVGSFGSGIAVLRARGFEVPLREMAVCQRIPVLGICLGMQLLASLGTEPVDVSGLGLVDGTVRRLVPTTPTEKVPHVGWNEVHHDGKSPLFRGIDSGRSFYFVHSYRFEARHSTVVAATTPHCGGFVSAVQQGNIFGVQFHPEKSQRAGLALLANFLTFAGG